MLQMISDLEKALLNNYIAKLFGSCYITGCQPLLLYSKNVPDAIRTHDLLLRREMLYPTELQAQLLIYST